MVKVRIPTDEDIAHGKKVGLAEHKLDGKKLVFRPSLDAIDLQLVNGLRVVIPRKIVPELADLPESLARKMRLGEQGGTIEVRSQDIDISVRVLIRTLFGVDHAAKGGRVKSPAKSAAARANGRLGGRPRKRELIEA
jgi:hypothetical protein